MTSIKILGSCIIAVILTACASGSHILTGMQRPAVNPATVAVYAQAPNVDYEIVASLEASSSRGVTQQGRMDSAVKTLIKEAADIGANGIILDNLANHTGGVTTHITTGISGGTHGFSSLLGTGVTINPALIKGTAIYVFDAAKSR